MNSFRTRLLRGILLSGIAITTAAHAQQPAPVRLDGQALDPAMQAMLAQEKADSAKAGPEDATTPQGLKHIRDGQTAVWSAHTAAPPKMQSVENRSFTHAGVTIPVRIYRPVASGPLPIIVYYHGGAWFIGGIDASDRSSRQLADDARAIVVSVDYRLSPEVTYPAAWDDAENAYAWVVDQAKQLGGAPDQVCVGGDSAGGNLAISVTTRRLNKREAAPLCQILYYPAVDNRPVDTMRATYTSSRLFGEGFALDRAFTDYILPVVFPGEDLAQAEISPLLDTNRRMPPTLVAVAGFDPLRDSQRAYAGKLIQSGNTVVYREYPTLIHGFLQRTATSADAVRASRETAQAAGVLAREAVAARGH